MSPRAACRLETLGFRRVYDYVAGKSDWLASGRPREGRLATVRHSGDYARPDVPTCRLDERMGEVRERAQAAGWTLSVVTTADRIVMGMLDGGRLDVPADRLAEDVMRSGPSTFRPNVPVDELAAFLRDRDLQRALISTPDGQLLGMAFRADLESAERADE